MIGQLALGWLASHWWLVAALAVFLAACAKPLLVWKLKAWILLAVVAWWGWTGHAAYDALKARTDTERAIAAAEIAVARAQASEAARVEEQARAEAVAYADRTYQKGLKDGKAAADRVLADVAAGRLVLRDRFRCAPPGGGAAAPAAGAGGGDGGAAAGLSDEDVQFLVRLAQEADDVVRQLQAAQAVIEADRAEVKR